MAPRSLVLAAFLSLFLLSLRISPTESAKRLTGSFPIFATVPKYLSTTFRHSSVGYSTVIDRWTVPPSVNWPIIQIYNNRSCASSWFNIPVVAFSLLLARIQQQYPDEVQKMLNSISSLQSLFGGVAVCFGGWPYVVLDTVSLTSQTLLPSFAVLSYEQPDLHYDWTGLLLTVQRQPAIVFIYASSVSFQQYKGGIYNDPLCSLQNVDHSVIVAGYDLTGRRPYWILVNSWGPLWGINGTMRIEMTGGQGVCNMLSVAPIYPVIKLSLFPCLPINPCGSGSCSVNTSSFPYTAVCDCPPSFVVVKDSLGSQTCLLEDVCNSFAFNPCGPGTCINDGEGGYECDCPVGKINSTRADGTPVCISADNDTTCTYFYTWSRGDTCETVAVGFLLTVTQFVTMNPWINCRTGPGIGAQVCVYNNGSAPCNTYYVPTGKETCNSVMLKYSLTSSSLFGLNPGLNCDKLYPSLMRTDGVNVPAIGAQICVEGPRKRVLTDAVGALPGGGIPSSSWLRRIRKKGRKLYTASSCAAARYRVKRGDFCASIISKYCGGSVPTFQRLNRGFVCTNDKLYVGQILCTLRGG